MSNPDDVWVVNRAINEHFRLRPRERQTYLENPEFAHRVKLCHVFLCETVTAARETGIALDVTERLIRRLVETLIIHPSDVRLIGADGSDLVNIDNMSGD